MCATLQPHGLQYARLPCPSLSPRVCSNSSPSNQDGAIQPSHPLSSSPPVSIISSVRVFSNESSFCIKGPKYWNFSFNKSPSIQYSGLISFRIDWFDLLAVQGTLKSLLHTTVQSIKLQSSASL